MALINQQAAANAQPPVGFLNPTLYTLAQSAAYSTAFHDITKGNNTNDVSLDRYFATADTIFAPAGARRTAPISSMLR